MTESIVASYLDDEAVRPTVMNWENLLKDVADGYKEHKGIIHGLQKDAIQNGWDAKKTKKGKNWKFTFEFVRGESRIFFIMTDEGTYGLTGRILEPEELMTDLSKKERLGRFLSMAFTKSPSAGETPLGSRGRGKLIFVAASKTNTILFDSLREDGTYIFGFRTITKTGSPVAVWMEEEGKQKLQEITNGVFDPLDKIGTRVFVVDPIQELINDINTGAFLKNIEETWWEIIQKYNATIVLRIQGKEQQARLPSVFNLPEEDTADIKVWIKTRKTITEARTTFTVKKLHIVSISEQEIPENIRGVSIQRGGMKICSIQPRYMDKKLTESFYGYIVLDSDTEIALRIAEGVEHYSFDFKKRVPQVIRRYIEDEIITFARNKLGYRSDARKIRRNRQRNAEQKALRSMNNILAEYGLGKFGPKKGDENDERERNPAKPIRVKINKLGFPRSNDRRLNYGETLENITATIVNDTDQEIAIQFKLYVIYGEKESGIDFVKTYKELDVRLPKKSHLPLDEVFSQKISEDNEFRHKGLYTIRARLVSLMVNNRGDKLDVKGAKFWVEEEPPPSSGLFEKFEGVGYPKTDLYIRGEYFRGESGGMIVQYNVLHPDHLIADDDENDLALYLFRLLAIEACKIDAIQEKPRLFTTLEFESTEDVITHTSRVIGELIYKHLQ